MSRGPDWSWKQERAKQAKVESDYRFDAEAVVTDFEAGLYGNESYYSQVNNSDVGKVNVEVVQFVTECEVNAKVELQ